jgi:uncharacterized membrane protein YuzA (DUF378 family)
MAHLVVIFLVGFASVFMLGFQSRSVNHGNYALAAVNSFFIAVAQTQLWSSIVHDGSWAATLAYASAGCCAIVSSMWVHQRFFIPKR